MMVTEVKIKLVVRTDDRLLAFASITFDRCFVVRDIKIIQGASAVFVAMPSRKMSDRCPSCSAKNHLQARFCNHCGREQSGRNVRHDRHGRAELHADIVHPINFEYRQDIHNAVLKGYDEELERSRQPGYVPSTQDGLDAGPECNDAATNMRMVAQSDRR